MNERATACFILSLPKVLLLLICMTSLGVSAAVGAEPVEPEPIFHVDRQSHAASLRVYNPFAHAITVTVELSGQENLRVNPATPATVIVPARAERRVLRLHPIQRREPWSYDYTWSWKPGSADAIHDERTIYTLPYPPGHAYPLSQGAGGGFSHKDRQAFDWSMPEGAPVHAARGGLVVRVVKHFTEGALDESLKDKANRIHILHNDQTLGRYLHLMHEGATVQVGQRVDAGELIGYAGNTGYSQGPHLHFDVYAPQDGKTSRTFPVRFDVGGDEPAELEQVGAHYLRPFQQPAEQRPPLPLNTIGKLVTAPGIVDGQPDSPRSMFQADALVHAHATLIIPGNYTLRFVFSNTDDPAVRYERTVALAADGQWAWASLDLGRLEKPAGTWQVEVLIDEQSFKTSRFNVK